jgi:lipid-binding SYLF domain-containing protein
MRIFMPAYLPNKGAWISLLASAFIASPALSGPLWDKTKEIGSSTVSIVEKSVEGTVDTVGRVTGVKEVDGAAERQAIDAMAKATLDKLLAGSAPARTAHDQAYGVAVFDSRVSSLGITTGSGKGVAYTHQTGRQTGARHYMRMATAGLNLGAGVQYYKVIFLFPDAASFANFVKVGWDAGAGANAAVGKDGAAGGLTLANGVRLFQINEEGIILKVSLTGTKYWVADDLN